MPLKNNKGKAAAVKEMLLEDADFLRPMVQEVVQQVLEAEMDETVGAEKGERTSQRLGYRSGYYSRTLVTRVGKLELRVPRIDKAGFAQRSLIDISGVKKHWWSRWQKCMSMVFRRVRSKP